VLRDGGGSNPTAYREADAFLNVTGAQEIREEHLACPRRIYVESDPFTSQVRVTGDAAMIAALAVHDTLFSFGENLGALDCHAGGALPLAANAPAGSPGPVEQPLQH